MAEDGGLVKPLRITARLVGGIVMPHGPPFLDAMLMAGIAMRDNLPPMHVQRAEIMPPLARSSCGRIWLASQGIFKVEESELTYKNRRFPMGEAQAMASPKVKSILTAGGLSKGFRTPWEKKHLVDDLMTFYAVGDHDAVVEILSTCITHIGKGRGAGAGKVAAWTVEGVEPWEGFPVLRDGEPLRPLPIDWPGVDPAKAREDERVLEPPYHELFREEPLWTAR